MGKLVVMVHANITALHMKSLEMNVTFGRGLFKSGTKDINSILITILYLNSSNQYF